MVTFFFGGAVLLKVVAGLISDTEGRVLACRRKEDGPHAGKWEFPGGKVRDGETPEQALHRELREELAVEATVGPLLRRIAHDYPDGPRVDVAFYRIEGFTGAIENLAFDEVRWVEPGRLRELDFLEADRPFVEEL